MKNTTYIEKEFIKIKERHFSKYQNLHKKKFKSLKKDFIIEISRALNHIHNKKYSFSEWRILIGPWLNIALNIYFYYNFFIKFLSKNSKEKIIEIKSVKYLPPLDYIEFFRFINTKKYQIYFLKILISNNFFNPKINNINTFRFQKNLKKNIFIKLIELLATNKTKYIIRSRFKINDILYLVLKSKFKILPLNDLTQLYNFEGVSYNKDKRLKFLKFFSKKNFHVAKFITQIIPSSYIENFYIYEKIGKKILNQPEKIYTDTAHLDDDLFKTLIFNWSSNKDFKILIGQHGGNHRIHDQYVTNYNDDYEICCKYLVWGKSLKKKEVKLSSVRLFNLNTEFIKPKNIKHDVCYVFEALRENQFQGDFKRNDDFIRSLGTKRKFLKIIKKNFVVKSYYEKNRYKEQISNRSLSKYLKINPKLFRDDKEVIFESNIVVIDYMSTMIFELISLNIPFVLILENSNEYLSNFGKKFINDLKKINLFFSDSSKAANFINNLSNFDKWWLEEKRQKKILELKKNYAYVSKYHINDWYKILKN